MPYIPYNQSKEIGLLGERLVFPLIEQFLCEPITHTPTETDTLDGETPSYWIELKTRNKPYSMTHPLIKKDGLLLPECKIKRASSESKPTYFFYYFLEDDSLWYYKYNSEDFVNLKPVTPYWTRQSHYFVPASLWEEVETVEY